MRRRGTVMGLDYGTRRIGIALSDPEASLAFPAGCLERGAKGRDLAALRTLAEEREVERIVVGLPLHMDGRAGPEAEAARAFAGELARETGLEVELLDERWTSVEAERTLREAPGGRGRRARRRRQGSVDELAATLLLRTYLERERSSRGREAP